MGYKSITTISQIEEYLGESKKVAFDFETSPKEKYRQEPHTALDPHKADITGISLSVSEGTAIYVPLRHRVGRNADPKEVMDYLKEAVFLNDKVIKIAHNLAFEAMFLYKKGIVLQTPVYDTIAAAQLTLKNSYEFRTLADSGLKTLVPYLYEVEMPSFEMVTAGRHFDELDPQEDETIRYACADADYTLRLYETINNWFDRYLPRHRVICEMIESPAAVYTGMMKYNGIWVDAELMKRKQKEATERIKEIKDRITFMIGDVDIGENAGTRAFKDFLYKELKLPVVKTTAKFKEAADDEALQMLTTYARENRSELVELLELVQEYRKWAKLKSTYIDGYLQHINRTTGRIHPNLMPLGTDTGRFACRKPNFQNQPQPGNDPVGVRNFMIAPERYSLVEADYSQVELKIGAYLSQDRTMIAAYQNSEDIHAITTAAVFGVPLEEAKDKHRQDYKKRRVVAKATMFGIMYGISPKGLQRNLKTSAGLDFSQNECKAYIQNIKSKSSGLAAWQISTIKTAGENKYVETALGRRRYLKGINSTNYSLKSFYQRAALNTPVQGFAADCLKLAMGRLVEKLKDYSYIKPILTVHDSLVFVIPNEKVQEAIPIIKACMEQGPPVEGFNVQLTVEVSEGQRYGEMNE